jgi:hypothetical protein
VDILARARDWLLDMYPSASKERHLDAHKLITTSADLERWITKEFHEAHLAVVAREVHAFAQEAVAKAEKIRQPIWALRLGIWTVVALLVAGAVHGIVTHEIADTLKFLDTTKGAAVYLSVFGAIFIGLEIRWKRHRALKAVAEIRALAHIVDMHQLAKDPPIEQFRQDGRQVKVMEYLHACTALLALLSKVAQFYVENFPDPVATNAVNDFEMITTGLSNKIWMKILSMKGFDPPREGAGYLPEAGADCAVARSR